MRRPPRVKGKLDPNRPCFGTSTPISASPSLLRLRMDHADQLSLGWKRDWRSSRMKGSRWPNGPARRISSRSSFEGGRPSRFLHSRHVRIRISRQVIHPPPRGNLAVCAATTRGLLTGDKGENRNRNYSNHVPATSVIDGATWPRVPCNRSSNSSEEPASHASGGPRVDDLEAIV